MQLLNAFRLPILRDARLRRPEMALRIGKFCGNGPEVWLRMQASYDLWHARQKLGNEIASIKTEHEAA